MTATGYDSKRWDDAHAKYIEDPKTLTEVDIEQLAVVSSALAERARAKRAGFVPALDPKMKAYLDQPVTRGDFKKYFDDIVSPILATYRHRIKTLSEEVDRLKTAGTSSGVEYAGTFQNGRAYAAGKLVTKGGGMWLSLKMTATAPGTDHEAWRLVVKEGHAR